MPKGFDKCISEMRKAAGKIDDREVLDTKTATKILKSLVEERKQQKRGGLNDPDLEFIDKINKQIQAEQTAAIIEKRNAAINMLRKKEFFDGADNFDNDYDALVGFMSGIHKGVKGSRDSAATRQMATFTQYVKGFLNDLEKEELLPFWKDKKNSLDIAVELEELDILGGKPGRTNNTPAIKIAKIVRKYQDDTVARQNKAGAWIQKIPGYIVKQEYSQERIRKLTSDEFIAKIVPRLDLERTFPGMNEEQIRESLLESYKGITTGKHLTVDGSLEADGLVAFRGPGSIGRSVSEHRMFHYKSASDWHEFNAELGTETVQNAIMDGLGRASRNIALMEKMGPNPKAFYETIKQSLLDRNRDRKNLPIYQKIEGSKQLNPLEPTPDHVFKELIGETSRVSNITIARIGQSLRQWIDMVSLGGSVFSQLPDLAAKAADIRFHGEHPFTGYKQAFEDIFFDMAPAEKKRAAKAAGAFYDGILYESIGRYMGDDPLPGAITTLHRLFFKLNFMEWWNRAQKSGNYHWLTSYAAAHSDLPFSELHPKYQNSLELYNIGAPEWEIIKQAKTKMGEHEYIMPELIQDQELRSKYQGYLDDRTDYAILTPGVYEKAATNRGQQAGTWEGEAWRSFAQFKLFSISVITKLLPKEYQGGNAPDLFGVIQLITGATLLGYLSMSAKDIAKGLKPRPLEDPKTITAAFIQGGGAGIYGDFLFGEYDRYGASIVGTAAGPVLSHAEPIAKMFSKAVNGKLEGAEVFQFAKNNTPFLNLFYLRSALDYLILYDIQESLNPGFLRRMEKRIMDDRAQEFILPPSQNPGVLR